MMHPFIVWICSPFCLQISLQHCATNCICRASDDSLQQHEYRNRSAIFTNRACAHCEEQAEAPCRRCTPKDTGPTPQSSSDRSKALGGRTGCVQNSS